MFKTLNQKNTIYYKRDKREFWKTAAICRNKPCKFVDPNYEFANLQVFDGL